MSYDGPIRSQSPRKLESELVHGTIGGYKRHLERDELPCDECLEAERVKGTQRRRKMGAVQQTRQCNAPRCLHPLNKHQNTKGRCLVKNCGCTMYYGPRVPKGPVKVPR